MLLSLLFDFVSAGLREQSFYCSYFNYFTSGVWDYRSSHFTNPFSIIIRPRECGTATAVVLLVLLQSFFDFVSVGLRKKSLYLSYFYCYSTSGVRACGGSRFTTPTSIIFRLRECGTAEEVALLVLFLLLFDFGSAGLRG